MIPTLPHLPEAPDRTAPLADWLAWLETIHPVSIDMGLARVSAVADRLKLRPITRPLVLVGGTNGKGSTVAMLTAIYVAAGYRVGTYTSPHISDFRERICINGVMAAAQDIVDALTYVESGRAPETLTYFEYTTLAAMRVFKQAHCDVYIMEVGLGGRLDATNIWDADCSVVTSIALDHEDYLGSDINVIATEKAAIGRPGKTLVVGDTSPPASLFSFAHEKGIPVEFTGSQPDGNLPVTSLAGPHQRRNAACALAVLKALQPLLPVSSSTAQTALMNLSVPARFERIELENVIVVLDVAHNPAGASSLVDAWKETFGDVQAELVFSALADKDLPGIVTALDAIAAAWHCLALTVPRATPLARLLHTVEQCSDKPIHGHDSAADAWQAALAEATAHSRPILVAGSFHTIAEIRALIPGR